MTYILDRCYGLDPIRYGDKTEAFKAAVRHTYDTGYRSRVYQDGLILMSSDVTNGQVVMCTFGYSPVKVSQDLTVEPDGSSCVSTPNVQALLSADV